MYVWNLLSTTRKVISKKGLAHVQLRKWMKKLFFLLQLKTVLSIVFFQRFKCIRSILLWPDIFKNTFLP